MDDWVRVTFIDPAKQSVLQRDLIDPWYRLGGHQHPDRQNQARHDHAAEELREWLRRWQPSESGEYVAWVAAWDPLHGETGRTWANAKVMYAAPSPGKGPK